MFQIGQIKLTPVEFGRFKLDGGAMFGVVPRVLWERFHPADEHNRIEMALRCLLIEVNDRKILVDTGFGEGRSARFREQYAYQGDENSFDKALNRAGATRESITDVVITHLHFDHCGGSTIHKHSQPQPSFPNAKYHLQKRQLEHARARFERDRASYFREDFEPLISAGVVNIVDGGWELLPGVSAIVCDGHTPAMQLVKVSDGGQTLLYAADLIPLSSHFPLPWIMAYDLYPVTTLTEKKQILTQAAQEGWLFFFEHDAERITGRVKLTERGFGLAE